MALLVKRNGNYWDNRFSCPLTLNLYLYHLVLFRVSTTYSNDCELQGLTNSTTQLMGQFILTTCFEVDGPRVCHTEWSKSEREKQILYINTYMWNLEKCYRWSYLQRRNRDTDVENKHMDSKREAGVGWIGRLGLTYIQYYVSNR